MKTFQFLSSIALASMLISCGGNTNSNNTSNSTASQEQAPVQAAPSIKKYPVKSGIITFDNDLMGIKQKSVLYFDDYGMKEADERYDGDAVKEITICDGKKRYSANFGKKVAYESGDCSRGLAYKFDWNEISKADQEYKVKKGPNRIIAGKDCESYTMEGSDYPSTFAGWNNICLFQETKSKYGTVTMKAVKVEEVDVPAEKFQVPAGFEVKKQ